MKKNIICGLFYFLLIFTLQSSEEGQQDQSGTKEHFCKILTSKKSKKLPLTTLIDDAVTSFKRAAGTNVEELRLLEIVYQQHIKGHQGQRELFFVRILIPFYNAANYDLQKYFLFVSDKLKQDKNFLVDILTEKTGFNFEEFASMPDSLDLTRSPAALNLRKNKVKHYNALKAAEATQADEQASKRKELNEGACSDLYKKKCSTEKKDSLSIAIAECITNLFDPEIFENFCKDRDKKVEFNKYVQLLKERKLEVLQSIVNQKKKDHPKVIFTVFEGVRLGFSKCMQDKQLQDTFFNTFLIVLNKQSPELLQDTIFRSYRRVKDVEDSWDNSYRTYSDSIASWTTVLEETEELYLENIMS